MKELVGMSVAYMLAGAAIIIGANAGNHIWSAKIEPKLKK